ncbi:MAG TPA: universal stress protein [Pseudonocardia sp.]|jgi:nucleotide-binding universal stress UspA family protein
MGSYKKVLVGTDGSDTSLRAVDRAGAVAGDAGAELLIICAYEPASKEEVQAAADALKSDAYQVVGSAPAESVLRSAADRARAVGASRIDVRAIQGPPVDVLDQAVADTGADLLVVGNVGLNTLTGRILGSVPQSVARRSGVDVLIVHTT